MSTTARRSKLSALSPELPQRFDCHFVRIDTFLNNGGDKPTIS
jgi:hypothetical protein